MLVVKFNVVEEFCQELEKDVARVYRKIVRLTNQFRASRLSPMIQHVIVVSTYAADGQIIKLERYCGDIWGINQEQDDGVLEKASTIHRQIEEACAKLDLQVRPGCLEE